MEAFGGCSPRVRLRGNCAAPILISPSVRSFTGKSFSRVYLLLFFFSPDFFSLHPVLIFLRASHWNLVADEGEVKSWHDEFTRERGQKFVRKSFQSFASFSFYFCFCPLCFFPSSLFLSPFLTFSFRLLHESRRNLDSCHV